MRPPTTEELTAISERFDFELDAEDIAQFKTLIEGGLAAYDAVERMDDPGNGRPVPEREEGHRPSPEENPHNAWAWRARIGGAGSGRLAGRSVAVKDNIAVAGVPMSNGSAVLDGYVPDFDATVVTRVLDAGATILGKAACEDLCMSGSSHTALSGPVQNPRRPGFSAGGSSSGSAALVAAGEADLALAADQGGSIRVPSACCGVVGLKPTYGLVPYTGISPMEMTLDHVGPVATSVADVALLLEVLAGRDDLDPRQPSRLDVEPYADRLGGDLASLRVGVVEEGFGWEAAGVVGGGSGEPISISEPEVDDRVRAAAARLAEAGATVADVAIPAHRDGIHLWSVIAMEGGLDLMVRGSGSGTNWKGFHPVGMAAAYRRGFATRAAELSDTVKLATMIGEHVSRETGGSHYAKAQNLARSLTAAYDEALERFDVLVMPTCPVRPKAIPAPDAPREEAIARAFEMANNACQTSITGHPAISVPCQEPGEYPVGMMIVGRRFADAEVLRVAGAYEAIQGGWPSLAAEAAG